MWKWERSHSKGLENAFLPRIAGVYSYVVCVHTCMRASSSTCGGQRVAVLVFLSTSLLVFETGSLAPNLRPSSPWDPPVSAHPPLRPWGYRLHCRPRLYYLYIILLSCLPGVLTLAYFCLSKDWDLLNLWAKSQLSLSCFCYRFWTQWQEAELICSDLFINSVTL